MSFYLLLRLVQQQRYVRRPVAGQNVSLAQRRRALGSLRQLIRQSIL
jgi:hypothetical protein